MAKVVNLYWGTCRILPLESLFRAQVAIVRIGLPVLELMRTSEDEDENENENEVDHEKSTRGWNCLFNICVARLNRRFGLPNDLFEMLYNSDSAESSLPQDRYFALVGLTTVADEHSLIPNYEEPLTKIAVRYMKVLLEAKLGPKILSVAQPRISNMNLPSWIPDWSALSQLKPLASMLGPLENDHYRTATAYPTDFCISEDGGILNVRSALFDRIVGTGHDNDFGVQHNDPINRILALWMDAWNLTQHVAVSTGKVIKLQDLWEVVTMDIFGKT
jgi:hypothetical protein